MLENVRLAVQARRGLGSSPGGTTGASRISRTARTRSWPTCCSRRKWAAPAGTLAHGEKRKLELGILLALEPALLLLDEPTAGMSLEEVPAIVALIDADPRAARPKTILLVEHKIDMVMALSDTIAVLKDGRLIADGTARGGRAGTPRSRPPTSGAGLLAHDADSSSSRTSTPTSASTTSSRASPCASGRTR